jgi:hypothetical protein
MSDLIWAIGAVVVCGGLFFIASRIEPHWVARENNRFLATAEPIDRWGNVIGRRREVRVAILPDGGLMVSRRSLMRTTSGVWQIQSTSPKPPRGKNVYLMRPIPPDPEAGMLALRVPTSSRIVPILDELAPDASGSYPVNAPRPDPESRPPDQPADPG